MPTIIDTKKKLSSYTVSSVMFIRDTKNVITDIIAYDVNLRVLYHYRNIYGTRHDKRANALRTLVISNKSAFYLNRKVIGVEVYYNNRLINTKN